MGFKFIADKAKDAWGEFSGAADTARAQKQYGRDIRGAMDRGISGYEGALESSQQRLDPFLMGGTQAQNRLTQELFSPSEISTIPGYSSMVSARQEGLSDLATGRAGLGTLFSGRTAEEAANLSGGMEQQLRNMFMGQLQQQAGMGAGIGQFLGNQEVGTAGNIANLLMGGTQAASGMNVNAAQTQQQATGDLINAGATLAGYMMGGPAGGMAAGGMTGGGGYSYNPMTRQAPTFGMGY